MYIHLREFIAFSFARTSEIGKVAGCPCASQFAAAAELPAMADTGNSGDRMVTECKSFVLSALHGGISACKAVIWVLKSGALWDGEMASPSRSSQRIRFAEFVLDLDTGEFWNNGQKLVLARQPFQVLQVLLERPGQLVTRETLIARLWPSNTFVDFDQGLKKAVNRLREALNDSADQPRYIENLPRRGYRFIANLELHAPDRSETALPAVLAPHLVTAEGMLAGSRRLRSSRSIAFWVSAIVICVAGILFWSSRVWRQVWPTPGEFKITQLTANSIEKPVTSSAISPDGKYLAFTDNAMKMHVMLLETGETQTISEPESLKGSPMNWSIAGWFPDSTRFLANARPPGSIAWFPSRFRVVANASSSGSTESPTGKPASIWVISKIGTKAQKLRDDADAFSVSPDGSMIAFGTNVGPLGDREIWLMDTRGQQARKLYDASENTAIGGLNWSRDGQRAIYFQIGASSGELVSRDLRGGPAITLVGSSDLSSLTDFVWSPDGRLIYARDGNFWELRVDSRSGKPVDKARQLTNLPGFWVGETSVTSDGRRLAFQRLAKLTTVNVTDIEPDGAHGSSARHLTLNEYVNAAETWTPDSNALIFRSLRNGHLRLFRQALDSDIEEPLVMGAENVAGSAISPDGSWLYYLDCGVQVAAACEGTVPLMGIPIQGGTPLLVLKSNTYGRPRCAVSPASVCIIAEQSEDGKPLLFTAFDSKNGRGAVLAKFETEPAATYSWSLSHDGARIAILKNWDALIHIISLKGQAPEEITVKRWPSLAGVYWAADGKGWFMASKNQAGVALLHVDLQGEAHTLWELKGDTIAYGLPSPDGRRLAIVATTRNYNVWMLANF
jgi:DNA-binding winged helix-turn-helix (wHTH) protein/Tol biopolymer transport system component